MKFLPDDYSLIELIAILVFVLAAIVSCVLGAMDVHGRLSNKLLKQEKGKGTNLILVNYIISIFCISALTTLLVQYFWPPATVLGGSAFPIMRYGGIWRKLLIVSIFLVGVAFFGKKLFKD